MPTVLDSLNSALHHALSANGRVLLLGEDILDPYGGAFKITRGLSTAFPGRVVASPISEAGLVGVAAGMALRGLRPVVEIMFGDFLTLAADQLTNTIGKFRWMYNDQVRLPLVIRTPMGGRRGYGPTHSQSLEKLFLGVPGLTVLAPWSFSGRAPGSSGSSQGLPTAGLGQPGDLLSWAILDQDDPVLFVENKLQYLLPLLDESSLADVDLSFDGLSPAPTYLLTVRGAPSAILTLTAYGYMAELARQAQLELAYQHEIFTELVIPTRLAPFELAPLLDSVARTRRILAIEEGTLRLGWGAEILARLAETDNLGLIAARRLAAPDLPLPASATLENEMLPGCDDIVRLARKMV